MPGETPEKGDTVSWGWGASRPSGQVADKITEGEASVVSKKGNTIKKKATSGDAALAIEREGNDVVKKASEVEVGSKANGKKHARDDDADDNSPDADGEPASKKGRGRPKGVIKKSFPPTKKPPAAKKALPPRKPLIPEGEKKKPGRPKGTGTGPKKNKTPTPGTRTSTRNK